MTYLLCLECGCVFDRDVSDLRNVYDECPDCGSTDLDLWDDDNGEHDQFNSDAEADADVLASAGMGTDEDYGYQGDDSF
jgi:predicted  nucleic acid-binding Zn-ribbon protein